MQNHHTFNQKAIKLVDQALFDQSFPTSVFVNHAFQLYKYYVANTDRTNLVHNFDTHIVNDSFHRGLTLDELNDLHQLAPNLLAYVAPLQYDEFGMQLPDAATMRDNLFNYLEQPATDPLADSDIIDFVDTLVDQLMDQLGTQFHMSTIIVLTIGAIQQLISCYQLNPVQI